MAETNTLRCPVCESHKEPDAFYRDRTRATGRAVVCKVCHGESSKRRRAVLSARTEQQLREAMPTEKRCHGECKQVKPAKEFSRSRTNVDALRSICKECASLAWRKWSVRKKAESKKS